MQIFFGMCIVLCLYVSGTRVDNDFRQTDKQMNVLFMQRQDHPAYGKHHGMSEREWWLDFHYRLFTAAGYHGSADSLVPMSVALIKHFAADSSTIRETLPHAVECLESFKRRGMILGLVSNCSDLMIPTLKQLELYSYFDFFEYSAGSGLEKPDPRMYKQALRAAGGVDPTDAGHVGDELIPDYFAPRTIGMKSFLFDPTRRYADDDLKDVDKGCVVNDLSELPQLIDVMKS